MVERAYRAHMHFGARTKGTNRKVIFFDKIANTLRKDANVSRELKVAVDHLAHSDNDAPRVKSMLDGIMRGFDFEGGRGPALPSVRSPQCSDIALSYETHSDVELAHHALFVTLAQTSQQKQA